MKPAKKYVKFPRIISAFLFALAHISNGLLVGFAGRFVGGVIYTKLYDENGILNCMIYHAIFNGIVVSFILMT